jgi:hypothetical protein
VAHSSSGSSDGVITPSSQFVTLDWHQLEERMQQRQKQQHLIVLEVQCPESQQQQQEEQQQQQQPPPCRCVALLQWQLSARGAGLLLVHVLAGPMQANVQTS